MLLEAPTLKIQYADHLRRSHIVGNSGSVNNSTPIEKYDDLLPIIYLGFL